MFNRFAEYANKPSETLTGVLARDVSPMVVCPMMCGCGMMGRFMLMQEVYRLAREQAEAAAKPSRLERLQTALSN